MPPWERQRSYRKCIDPTRTPLHGEWLDINDGECQRCKVTRRLYRPNTRPELAVCAPCTQIYAHSSLSHSDDEHILKLSDERRFRRTGEEKVELVEVPARS